MKKSFAWIGWLVLPLALQGCNLADKDAGGPQTPAAVNTGAERAFPGRVGVLKSGSLFGQEIDYLDIDGRAVVGGDIVLPPETLQGSAAPLGKTASAGRASGATRWINNVVYYRFATGFTGADKVNAAIAHWEANTSVRFVQWTPALSGHPDYIEFQSVDGDGCYSSGLGRVGGKQTINLDGSCGNGSAIHEIGHGIGLYHEQCRSDQANSIVFDLTNVSDADRGRFYAFNSYLRQPAPLDGTDFGSMDFGSVMMDGSFDFALDASRPVMSKVADGSTWAAQRSGLSAGDIAGVTAMYPSPWTTVSASGGQDIGVGANGTVWMIGTTAVNGGYQVLKRNGTGWTVIPGGAVRIDVDNSGNPWVINNAGALFYYATSWVGREQGKKFTDIGAGSEGSVFGVAQKASGNGFQLYKWTGSAWSLFPSGGAVRVTVDNAGNPWIINSAAAIQRWNKSSWETLPGTATDIGAGPDGSVYILETATVAGGQTVAMWNGSGWRRIAGGGKNIDVGPGGNPWMVNASGAVFSGTLAPAGTVSADPIPLPTPAGWMAENVLASDIGTGGTAANVVAWAISTTDAPAGGKTIFRKNGESGTWTQIPGGAISVDADAAGNAWVINDAGSLFYYNNTSWVGREQGKQFVDIGVNGTADVYGLVRDAGVSDYPVYKWNGSGWTLFPGAEGVRITVDKYGFPWVVTSAHEVKQWTGSAWETKPGFAKDIGAGSNGMVYKVGNTNVTGGSSVWSWSDTAWVEIAGGAAVLDVDPAGNPWLAKADGSVTRWNPGTAGSAPPVNANPDADPSAAPVPPVLPPPDNGIWTLFNGPGDIVAFSGSSTTIGYAIDKTLPGAGGYAVRWFSNGQSAVIANRFVDLDMGRRDCEVWAVTDSGTIFFNNDACNPGSSWQSGSAVPSVKFTSVTVGQGPNAGDPSIVYATTSDAVAGGYRVMKRIDNANWIDLPGGATELEAEDDWGLWSANSQLAISFMYPNSTQPSWLNMSNAGGQYGMGTTLSVGGGKLVITAPQSLEGWTSSGWQYLISSMYGAFAFVQIAPGGRVWATDAQHRIWYTDYMAFTPGPHPPAPGGYVGQF